MFSLSFRVKLIFVLLALVLLALLWPPYADAFIGDDYVQLDRVQALVERPSHFWQAFNPFWQPWYYRPLQHIWFWLNRLAFGYTPLPYYYLQIGLHLIVAALLFRVGRALGLSRIGAGATAVLFSWHGHHFDVVTWNAAIAIVMVAAWRLLALWAFLRWRHHLTAEAQRTRRKGKKEDFALSAPLRFIEGNGRYLALSFLFCLLAAFTHEEWILLPPLLLAWHWLDGRYGAKQALPLHKLFFGGLLFLMIAYVVMQFVRPNPLLSVSKGPAGGWLAQLTPANLGDFGLTTAVRVGMLFNLELLPLYRWSVLGLVLLIGYWFYQGGKIVRFGLLWWLLHLGFVYWALWAQNSDLYAGRHLYNSLIGLALAAGGTVDGWWRSMGGKLNRRGRRGYGKKGMEVGTAVVLLVIFWVYSGMQLQQQQARWETHIVQVGQAVQAQMKAILPQVTPQTHIFAYRFYSSPQYIRETAQVWYKQVLPQPADQLGNLQRHGAATADFYLFDYENGALYNLMPELQAASQTRFLWSQEPIISRGPGGATAVNEPRLVVAGPTGARRLGLAMELPPQEAELAWGYEAVVPVGAALQTAVLPPAGQSDAPITIRIGIRRPLGESEIVWEETLLGVEWQSITIPLTDYAGQTVQIWLAGTGTERVVYWANPRLTYGATN